MVRVSDVPHWTKSAGTIPPPPIMVCLLERAASVRPHEDMRVGVGVRVRVRRKYLFVVLNKVETF